MSPGDLERRFRRLFSEQLKAAGLTVSLGATVELDGLAEKAARTVWAEKSPLLDAPPEEEISRAEENIAEFVLALASHARAEGSTVLTAKSFDAALRGICPLWPIC